MVDTQTTMQRTLIILVLHVLFKNLFFVLISEINNLGAADDHKMHDCKFCVSSFYKFEHKKYQISQHNFLMVNLH